MTAKEAYKIIIKHFPDRYVESCTEYKNYYVFSTIPKGMKSVFDGIFSVNKKNGKISAFQPSSISQKDYKSGKRILGYK